MGEICRPSRSSWASSFHMVLKGNGMWRPCGVYSSTNKITIPDRYPITHFQDYENMVRKCFQKLMWLKRSFRFL